MDNLEILTPEQVAELLQVSVGWVREKVRARAKNPIPTLQFGKYTRFSKADVLEWVHSTSTAKKGRTR